MKNRNPLTKLALLFTVLLTLGAATAQADKPSLDFAPLGLTDQTAPLNLVNLGVPGGMFIHWSFIDGNGIILAQSTVTLPLGQTVSFDYARQAGPAGPPTTRDMRVHVDILTPNVPAQSLHASLEIVDNVTGATTVCMASAAP